MGGGNGGKKREMPQPSHEMQERKPHTHLTLRRADATDFTYDTCVSSVWAMRLCVVALFAGKLTNLYSETEIRQVLGEYLSEVSSTADLHQ